MYHVMSRGDRREKIFLDDIDGQDFIKTLAEACQKTGWQVHAYCLMPNHYHVALETPEPNLVAGMAWLQSTYTIRLLPRRRTRDCTNTCAARPQTTQRKHLWVSEPMKRNEEERTKLWVDPFNFYGLTPFSFSGAAQSRYPRNAKSAGLEKLRSHNLTR